MTIRAAAAAATLLALASCAAVPEPSTASTSDRLPVFRMAPPSRMRSPSAERPSWLPSLPADLPRFRTLDDGFRDDLALASDRSRGGFGFRTGTVRLSGGRSGSGFAMGASA